MFEQLVNSRAVTISPPPPPGLVVLDLMLLVTFNIYDGLSFQHLATVLISVFMLCYGPGLLFRGQLCIIQLSYVTEVLDNCADDRAP